MARRRPLPACYDDYCRAFVVLGQASAAVKHVWPHLDCLTETGRTSRVTNKLKDLRTDWRVADRIEQLRAQQAAGRVIELPAPGSGTRAHEERQQQKQARALAIAAVTPAPAGPGARAAGEPIEPEPLSLDVDDVPGAGPAGELGDVAALVRVALDAHRSAALRAGAAIEAARALAGLAQRLRPENFPAGRSGV